jgi:mono/diheme cytochrome c family protein
MREGTWNGGSRVRDIDGCRRRGAVGRLRATAAGLMVVFGATVSAANAAAQSAAATTPATYTTEQATRGEKVYTGTCIECHEKLEYTGPDFRAKWNNRPVFELFDLLRTTMPDENPGTLSAQEYADVLAYMLRLNGVPPSKTVLPKDAAELKKLLLVIPKN